MIIRTQNRDGHHASLVGGKLTAPTREGLDAQIEAVRTRASKLLGRPATDAELVGGLARPALSTEDRAEIGRKRATEQYLDRIKSEADYSPENARLEAAQHRLTDERRSKMTAAERELADATEAAAFATARKADEAKRKEVKATPAYQSTLKQAQDLVFAASFDESITSAQLVQIQDQLTSLNETLDVATVRTNLRVLQSAIADQLAVKADQLKQASDAIAMRKAALGEGLVWDDIGVEALGETEYVSLTVGTEVRKVTKERYESRESDESLRNSLFGEAVANV